MLKVKLSIGEIELSEADIKALYDQIDCYLSGADETVYNQLKVIKSAKIVEMLEKMAFDQLVATARLHERSNGPGHLTNKFRTEIFKRNGLGHKNVSCYLSGKQRDLLQGLGLKNR